MSERVGPDMSRHRTTLRLNDEILDSKRRSMSNPTLSDIDFKNKMAWVRTSLENFQYNGSDFLQTKTI